MRMHSRTWLFATVVLGIAASTSLAHFLWIDSKAAEVGLEVLAGFGEPEGWDPEMVDRIKSAKYWIRGANRELQPLELTLDSEKGKYRAKIAGTPPTAILGVCDMGVVSFGKGKPFWLRYTSKELVGAPGRWNDVKASEPNRIEVLATRDGNGIRLTTIHLGKPLADATIKAFPPKGDKIELKTDSSGTARWSITQSGRHQLYVGGTVAGAGEHDGKTYDNIKDYATLTFTLSAADVALSE